jgi:hypothetical protein
VDPDEVVAKLLAFYCIVFKEYYGIALQSNSFLLSRSSKPTKESFHVTVRQSPSTNSNSNQDAAPKPCLAFQNTHVDQKQFMKYFEMRVRNPKTPRESDAARLLLDDEDKPVFDMGVYTRNRLMRTLGSSKAKEPARMLRPYQLAYPLPQLALTSDFVGSDTIVSSSKESDTDFLSNLQHPWCDYLVTYVPTGVSVLQMKDNLSLCLPVQQPSRTNNNQRVRKKRKRVTCDSNLPDAKSTTRELTEHPAAESAVHIMEQLLSPSVRLVNILQRCPTERPAKMTKQFSGDDTGTVASHTHTFNESCVKTTFSFRLPRNHGCPCPILNDGRAHNNPGYYLQLSPQRLFTFHCFQCKGYALYAGTYVASDAAATLKQPQPPEVKVSQHNQPETGKSNQLRDPCFGKRCRVIRGRYLSDCISPQELTTLSTVALKSLVGTGKTTLIANYIGYDFDAERLKIANHKKGSVWSIKASDGGASVSHSIFEKPAQPAQPPAQPAQPPAQPEGPPPLSFPPLAGHILARILFITNRRSLASSLSEKLKSLGFANYQTVVVLSDYERVVVQLDSLKRLAPRATGFAEPFDLVVLDELESVLAYMQSYTLMGKRRCVWETFRHYVSTAHQVIAADADLGERGMAFLRSTRSTVDVFWNTQKTDNKDYHIVPDRSLLIERIKVLVRKHKKVAVPTNSNKIAKQIQNEIAKAFPDAKVLLYNSEGDDKVNRDVGHCNEIWPEYDVVIYTPTIGCGVDFCAKHFDVVCGFGVNSNRSNTAREFLQQIGRIRNVKDNTVYLWLSPRMAAGTARLPTELGVLREYVIANTELLQKFGGEIVRIRPAHFETLDRYGWVLDPDTYTEILLYNVQERHASSNDFYALVLDGLKNRGGRVILKCPAIDETIRVLLSDEELKAMESRETERHKNECAAVSRAQQITTEEAHKLKEVISCGGASSQQKQQYRKWKIIQTYGIAPDAVTPKFVDAWGSPHNMEHFHNFARQVADPVDIYAKDKRYNAQGIDYLNSNEPRIIRKYWVAHLLHLCGFENGTITAANKPTTQDIQENLKTDQFLVKHFHQIRQCFRIHNKPPRGVWTPRKAICLLRSVLQKHMGLTVKLARLKRTRKGCRRGARACTNIYSMATPRRKRMMELLCAKNKKKAANK